MQDVAMQQFRKSPAPFVVMQCLSQQLGYIIIDYIHIATHPHTNSCEVTFFHSYNRKLRSLDPDPYNWLGGKVKGLVATSSTGELCLFTMTYTFLYKRC